MEFWLPAAPTMSGATSTGACLQLHTQALSVGLDVVAGQAPSACHNNQGAAIHAMSDDGVDVWQEGRSRRRSVVMACTLQAEQDSIPAPPVLVCCRSFSRSESGQHDSRAGPSAAVGVQRSHRPSLAVASGPDHPARARGVDAWPCSAGVRCAASAGAVSRLLANNSPRATPAPAPRAAGERAPASTARRTAHPASQPPTREPRRRRRAPRSYTRWDSCRYCVYPTRRKAAVASATQGCTEPARGGNAHSLCRR